jgi:hypothetical protein
LRKDRAAEDSLSERTTSVGSGWLQSSSSSSAWRVFGAVKAEASTIAIDARSA